MDYCTSTIIGGSSLGDYGEVRAGAEGLGLVGRHKAKAAKVVVFKPQSSYKHIHLSIR